MNCPTRSRATVHSVHDRPECRLKARERTGQQVRVVVAPVPTSVFFFTPTQHGKFEHQTHEKSSRANGVAASVFKNAAKTKDGETTFYKVALTRTYRDGDEFKSTNSLGRDDLPVAALLLQKAWFFITSPRRPMTSN